MYPYIFFVNVILFSVLISIVRPFHCRKNETLLLVIVLFLVLFLFAFRYNVGADYIAYNKIYDTNDTSYKVGWEVGFEWIFSVFQSLNLEFYVFSAFVLMINLGALFFLLYRETKYIVLGAAIYFLSIDGFFSSISFYRQSISVSFFMVSMFFLFESKWKKYILLNSCGALFHISNLVTIPVSIINFIRIEKKEILIIIPLISYILGQTGVLKEFIIAVLSLLGFYLEYIKTDAFSGESGVGIGFLLQFFVFFVLVLSSDIKASRTYKVVTVYSLYLCLTGISVNMLLFYRLAVVFSPIQAIAIPMLIAASRIKQKKILVIFVIFLYIILFIRSFSSPVFVRDFTPFNFVGLI